MLQIVLLAEKRSQVLSLAIFDLDNTLLAGDSDYLWGQFLVEQQLVDAQEFAEANQRFYQQYQDGTLDIHEYLAFALQILTQHPREQLYAWRRQFVAEKIEPIILPQAEALLARHRNEGHTLLIITATNKFVTAPIAERLDVPHLIASEPEIADNKYTGRIIGSPSFQHGKVTCLTAWLQAHPHELSESYFYSDSHNDLPLLSQVAYPVAVDPDARLAEHAQQHAWPMISLREAQDE